MPFWLQNGLGIGLPRHVVPEFLRGFFQQQVGIDPRVHLFQLNPWNEESRKNGQVRGQWDFKDGSFCTWCLFPAWLFEQFFPFQPQRLGFGIKGLLQHPFFGPMGWNGRIAQGIELLLGHVPWQMLRAANVSTGSRFYNVDILTLPTNSQPLGNRTGAPAVMAHQQEATKRMQKVRRCWIGWLKVVDNEDFCIVLSLRCMARPFVRFLWIVTKHKYQKTAGSAKLPEWSWYFKIPSLCGWNIWYSSQASHILRTSIILTLPLILMFSVSLSQTASADFLHHRDRTSPCWSNLAPKPSESSQSNDQNTVHQNTWTMMNFKRDSEDDFLLEIALFKEVPWESHHCRSTILLGAPTAMAAARWTQQVGVSESGWKLLLHWFFCNTLLQLFFAGARCVETERCKVFITLPGWLIWGLFQSPEFKWILSGGHLPQLPPYIAPLQLGQTAKHEWLKLGWKESCCLFLGSTPAS